MKDHSILRALAPVALIVAGNWVALAHSQDRVSYVASTRVEAFGHFPLKANDKTLYVKTFLPRTYLLYDIDPKDSVTIGQYRYFGATTQDGVRVYLAEEQAGKPLPYRRYLGEQPIIFHREVRLCKVRSPCHAYDLASTKPVDAGSVWQLISSDEQILQLRAKISNKIVNYYLPQFRFDELLKNGFVTDERSRLPPYLTFRHESALLRLGCGYRLEPRTLADAPSKHDRDIAAAFDIGSFSQGFGEPPTWKFTPKPQEVIDAELISFRAYRFTRAIGDSESSPDRTDRILVARISQKCDPSTRERGVITRVELVELGLQDLGKIVLLPWGSPSTLLNDTKHPYLFSVNTSEQYFALFEILLEKLEDRAVAAYLLAEFNASCPLASRRHRRCIDYTIRR